MTPPRRPQTDARTGVAPFRNPYADGFTEDLRERQLGVLTCVIAAGLLATPATPALAAVLDTGAAGATAGSGAAAVGELASVDRSSGGTTTAGPGSSVFAAAVNRIDERLERVESDVALHLDRLRRAAEVRSTTSVDGAPTPAGELPTWSWSRPGSAASVDVVEVAAEDLPPDVEQRMRTWLLPECAPVEPRPEPAVGPGTDRQSLVQEAQQQLDGCWQPFRAAVAAVLDGLPDAGGPVMTTAATPVGPSPVVGSPAAVRWFVEDWVDQRIDDVVQDVLAPTVAELELSLRELGARTAPAASGAVPPSPALLPAPGWTPGPPG